MLAEVDLCLIPEVPIQLEGPTSCLAHLERVVRRQGHAVVVIAEGAGEELLTADKVARGEKVEVRPRTPAPAHPSAGIADTSHIALAVQVDAGGNRKLPPIAPWFKGRVAEHFARAGMVINIKAVDPSYMVRSVPANPADAIYCTLLAQAAVNGAMAGLTGFSVGLTNNRLVYLPIDAITANSPRTMNPRGRTYERVISITGQPDPLSDPAVAATWKPRPGASTG